MPTYMTDEETPHSHAPAIVAHVKRVESAPGNLTPALCGDRYGFGVLLGEGEEKGEPFPYTEWCVVCSDLHHGDPDDPEGNVTWEHLR